MKLDLIFVRVLYTGAEVAGKCWYYGDQLVQTIPVVSRVRAFALDTLLGPEDDFGSMPRTLSNHTS